MMRRMLFVAVVVFVAAVPAAAFADGSIAGINADIAQLQSDVKVKHDKVLADAQQLQSDAQSLVGSDKATAKATIKSDVTKLTTDWQSLLGTCLKDRGTLQQDIAAAVQSGTPRSEIRPLVHEANLQIRSSNLAMRSGVASARAAVFALRQSFKNAGGAAPLVMTPPFAPTRGAAVSG
jgi:hypothetical protein